MLSTISRLTIKLLIFTIVSVGSSVQAAPTLNQTVNYLNNYVNKHMVDTTRNFRNGYTYTFVMKNNCQITTYKTIGYLKWKRNMEEVDTNSFFLSDVISLDLDSIEVNLNLRFDYNLVSKTTRRYNDEGERVSSYSEDLSYYTFANDVDMGKKMFLKLVKALKHAHKLCLIEYPADERGEDLF